MRLMGNGAAAWHAPSPALELRVHLHDNLSSGFHTNEQRIDLTTAGSVRLLEFAKLRARGADGRNLPARCQLHGDMLAVAAADGHCPNPSHLGPAATA